MAMDEWLFSRASAEPGALFLRLYTWRPGAVTVGYNQDISRAVDSTQLNGTPLIRRITGGRAIYHQQNELTYSIAANRSGSSISLLNNSLQQTSASISSVLVDFLSKMGIEAQIVRQSSAGFKEKRDFNRLDCFQSAACNEIKVSNSKVIGSAQRRIDDTFLQHGSIKLNGLKEHPALPQYHGQSVKLNDSQELGAGRFEELSEIFLTTMAEHLCINLQQLDLSEIEKVELTQAKEYVKNNSIEKRILIKQTDIRQSL